MGREAIIPAIVGTELARLARDSALTASGGARAWRGAESYLLELWVANRRLWAVRLRAQMVEQSPAELLNDVVTPEWDSLSPETQVAIVPAQPVQSDIPRLKLLPDQRVQVIDPAK